MLDLFKRTHWDQLYNTFTHGDPPLIFQLLVLNTAVLTLFAVRKMRGANKLRSNTASTVQSLLLAANIFIIMREDITHSVSWLF